MASMVGGFIVGFILSLVLVGLNVDSTLIGLSLLILLIGLPIASGIVVFKRTRADDNSTADAARRVARATGAPQAQVQAVRSRVSRKDLLAGMADFVTTQRVANEVIEKAINLDAKAQAAAL